MKTKRKKQKRSHISESFDDSSHQEVPVTSLNQFMNDWKIRVRVIKKSGVKTWHNAKGDGKLFCCVLVDNLGGEIRCTFFNEDVDKYYELVEENKVSFGEFLFVCVCRRCTSCIK